ncbi:hypothetical protein [Streptomyces sp. TLI_146]|uniref:hypothetical protein n=1 Tax=Streptomyces sp. TLI_146 TaxID=1938858 RepID=UPI000C706314|nr:hypothetical protein [Streptomyces sp. TLI_146]PKV89826.1 hypothetical protein BX283_7472 [Streptomyces sp. TLI_146]
MSYQQPLPDPESAVEGPTEAERTGRAAVRRQAQGMNHHEAAKAFHRLAARADSPAPEDIGEPSAEPDGGRRAAELAEWERIVDQLAGHAGTYDVESDPYVQGERTAAGES